MLFQGLLIKVLLLGKHPPISLSQMLKELLIKIIPNYQLSHELPLSHNIFLPREGLWGFVGNMGCNYPAQQHRGSGGKARAPLGGVCEKS